MLCKKFYATTKINNDGSLPSDLKEILLEYYILEQDVEYYEENYCGKAYGIEILKKELTINDDINIENNVVADIFLSKEEIIELINKLKEFKVTPISLDNILEDTVGIA